MLKTRKFTKVEKAYQVLSTEILQEKFKDVQGKYRTSPSELKDFYGKELGLIKRELNSRGISFE
jgi:hypothetical protein